MNKKYIIIASALICLTTSCSDFLEQDNRSNVSTSSFYNTSTGFESLTNSMYSSLRTIYNAQPALFCGGTDRWCDGKSQSVAFTYYTFTTADGYVQSFYQNCYKGIQAANAVISYGATTTQTSVTNQYIDEARFIRAWYYFQLVQQFGAVPLTNEMYSSAIMSFPRNSLKEVYDFIISEFTYLVSSDSKLLERSASGVGRANKRAANFFLAKAYLTRAWLNGKDYESQEDNVAQTGDFANAAKYALAAIAGAKPTQSIEKVFDINNETNDEIFWSAQFSSASVNDPTKDGSYQQAQFGSYLGGSEYPLNKAIDGNFAPSLHLNQLFARGDGRYEQTFMQEFHTNYFDYYTSPKTSKIKFYYAPWWATDADIAAWKADDPNGLKANAVISKTIATGGIAPSNGKLETYTNRRSMDFGVACVKKFDDYSTTSISNRSSVCSMHDVVLARLGEAYLIAAEAYTESGDTKTAADLINTLRSRPGTVKTGYETSMAVASANMSTDFILDERARELCGEYVRWTDLKRTHKLFEYIQKYQEDPIDFNNLKGTDGKWKCLRPIPQAAIDLNKAGITQNTGY